MRMSRDRVVQGRRLRLQLMIAFAVVLVIALLAIIAASCGGKKEVAEEQQASNEESQNTKPEETVTEPPVEVFPYKAPLTGVGLKEKVVTRPVMVMVENQEKARPQSGMGEADIVYELLAEGGITRFTLFYQSSGFKDAIGPVRSIRPYFIDLSKGYNALIVHAGGSNDAYAKFQREKLRHMDEITNAGGFYWRDNSRKAPHNLYTNLDKIRAGADQLKISLDDSIDTPTPTFTFYPEDQAASGDLALNVDIHFLMGDYKVSYTYDAESRLYKRFIDGEPHIDKNTGEQLTATNLVVLGANHKTLDAEGRLEINLTGQGKALLFERGVVQTAEWERPSVNDPIRLMKDGKELGFYPGKTYYHVVPNNPTFEEHVKYN